MKLFGCIAAKRFGRRARRHPRRQQTPLRPLALRWRRLPRPAVAGIVRQQAPSSNAWFSQVHLHLGWSTTVNSRFRQFPPRPPAAVPSARSFSEPLQASRSRRPGMLLLSTGHRPPRAAGVSMVFRRSVRVVDGAAIGVRQAMRHGGAQAPDIPVSSVSRRLRILAPAYRRDAIKVDAPVPPRSRPSVRQPLMWGRSTPRERTPDSRAVERLERVRTGKAPIELVWRARHSSAADASDGMMVVTGSAALPAPPTVSRSAVQVSPARVTGESEKARPVPLDPALVDRLTEDVIRRVERRVRIERERRGI